MACCGLRKHPPPAHWKHIGPFYYDPKVIHQRQVRRLQEISRFFDTETMQRLLIPVATASFDVSLRLRSALPRV
jgi:hypothetical protein